MRGILAWWRQRRAGAGRPGQSMIIIAMLLPVLVGLAGVALDGGRLYLERRSLQRIADAAALTGAQRANFNALAPAILSDGVDQARLNAHDNGLASNQVTVNLPPTSGPFAGDSRYIEVIVTRTVDNWFAPWLGIPSSTIRARAVARCFRPGYGDAAVLALNADNPDAIRFGGGGGSGVNIVGDVISYGGINPNANPSHFQIDGAAYAMNGPAPDLTATLGSFGTDSGVSLLEAADPIVEGLAAAPPAVAWPDWPTATGCAEIEDSAGVTDDDCDGAVRVQNNEEAEFDPGVYTSIDLQGGDSVFKPGVYVVGRLEIGAGASAVGDGVLFKLTGGGTVFDITGGAEFTFTAIDGNTWRNVVLYAPDGSIDLNGNGPREINGSVYAPTGLVDIAGSAGDSVVNGQVVAWEVEFNGNGPAVNYVPPAGSGTFGPVLVNTPNSGG